MHTNTMLQFRCPDCKAVLETKEEHAGSNCGCPNCEATITVPVQQALVPMVRRANLPEVIPADDDFELDVPRRRRHRDDDDKPMELRLGNYFGVKADVDKKTRSLLTSVSLGGILVALGAIIFAMFGGKSKSS
jgi:uncharacterized Zn finger protein (UPF0148 family)